MEESMDRRQRKTREAIFEAFMELLSEKNFNQITVEEIITRADIGRATFYAHFETKDFLLKELCNELFCHIFDSVTQTNHDHKHLFACTSSKPMFWHLLEHLQTNDNHILELLSSQNNSLFLTYFKEGLLQLISSQQTVLQPSNMQNLPDELWAKHVATTFIETVTWWLEHKKQESIETLYHYFISLLQLSDIEQ
jgi:AcrR family transcriptional regulator